MVVKNTTAFSCGTDPAFIPRVRNEFLEVPIASTAPSGEGSAETSFDIFFVKSSTVDEPVVLNANRLEVYDIDFAKRVSNSNVVKKAFEYFSIDVSQGVESKVVHDPYPLQKPYLKKKREGDILTYTANKAGLLSDNPQSPHSLTKKQSAKAVSITFSNRTKISVTLGFTASPATFKVDPPRVFLLHFGASAMLPLCVEPPPPPHTRAR
jgi:hypothetical protein